jgi:hypothetical protein
MFILFFAVKGARIQIEEGQGEAEDENEYQLRLKAERIIANRHE